MCQTNDGQMTDKYREGRIGIREDIICFEYFKQNIGALTGTITESLQNYLNVGVEDSLICRYIDLACEREVRKWTYIQAMIEGNLQKEIKTLDKFNIFLRDYKKSKQLEKQSNTKDVGHNHSGRAPNYANFDQREYTEEELEQFYVRPDSRYLDSLVRNAEGSVKGE
jgi:DnaD/phage-associated family protein